MDSNTTFEDEFMTDKEVIAEFGNGISGNEFMSDQEVMAEFGPVPSTDEFMSDSEVSEEFGGILEKLETVVEEAEAVDPKNVMEEAVGQLKSGSDEVPDAESDKGSSTTGSVATQANTLGSVFPKKSQEINDSFVNESVVSGDHIAKAHRVKFLQTKRGFGLIRLQDPPEVEVVKEAIRRLHLQLMNKVAKNDADYGFQIESICIAYDRLRKSCHEFGMNFEGKKRLSRKEKDWKELSQTIESESEKELGEFKDIKRAFILGYRPEGNNWTDILSRIRSTKNFIPLKNDVGAKTSDLKYGMLDGKKIYVKHEDRIADSEKAAGGGRKETEFAVATGDAQIDPGMTVSDRNVSSTRLADRLGLSDILARSETVFFQDRSGLFRVNSMEAIEGENVMDLSTLSDSVKKPGKKALYGKKITFSGNAAKQMFELQILDLISGQIDRHFHNLLAIFEIKGNEVIIKGLRGIDNDLSFGKMSADKGKGWLLPLSDTTTSEDGTPKRRTAIPFISRELYDRLMMPGLDLVLKFDQLDLRSEPEINALLERFTYIRNEIKDLHQRGLIQIIDDKEEFEKQYMERMRDMQDHDELIPSYMTRFVMERIFEQKNGNFMGKWLYDR